MTALSRASSHERRAATALASAGSGEAPRAECGRLVPCLGLAALAGQNNEVLPSRTRVLGHSSTCWWEHHLVLILALAGFPQHPLLARRGRGGGGVGKRNPVGSVSALLVLS